MKYQQKHACRPLNPAGFCFSKTDFEPVIPSIRAEGFHQAMAEQQDSQKDSNKEKALSAALAQIERQFGKGSMMRLGDSESIAIPAISTGSLGLDIALGLGAPKRQGRGNLRSLSLPVKTTLALQVVAEAQKIGGTCAFVDAEHALDPIYAEALGVDVDNLLVSQPDTGEQALKSAT